MEQTIESVREPASEQTSGDSLGTSLGGAAVRGALAGAIGGLALLATERAGSAALLPEGEQASAAGDAARALADARGAELSPAQTTAAGAGLALGYCALLGAVYGVVQRRLRPPDALHGLLLGGLSFAATSSKRGLLPRLGAQPPAATQPVERSAVPLLSHAAYGLTTAMAFDLLS